MIIHHVTLLTGHVATHRLDTIPAHVVAICRALLPDGGPIPGFSAFRVQIVESRVYTIWRATDPIVTCGIGRGDDDTWRALIALQERVQPIPHQLRAPRSRWLAVALMPGLALVAQDDIHWIGDFERCLAAALMLPNE